MKCYGIHFSIGDYFCPSHKTLLDVKGPCDGIWRTAQLFPVSRNAKKEQK